MNPHGNPGGPSAPPRRLDPLVALLLPTVIHRLGNATQLISGLNSMLGFGDDESLAMVASRSDDLTRAGEKATRVGYALGVLGSAQGTELLLARREPAGLEWMLDFLAEGLRREGRELRPLVLPHLAPAAADGWQPPWAVGRVLLAASLGPDGAGRWNLELRPEGWLLTAGEPDGPAWLALQEDFARKVPAVEVLAGPGASVVFPAGWFSA